MTSVMVLDCVSNRGLIWGLEAEIERPANTGIGPQTRGRPANTGYRPANTGIDDNCGPFAHPIDANLFTGV
jgi:hypothetical protein